MAKNSKNKTQAEINCKYPLNSQYFSVKRMCGTAAGLLGVLKLIQGFVFNVHCSLHLWGIKFIRILLTTREVLLWGFINCNLNMEGTYLEPGTSSPSLICACFQFAAPLSKTLIQCNYFSHILSLFSSVTTHPQKVNAPFFGIDCVCAWLAITVALWIGEPQYTFGHLRNHPEANYSLSYQSFTC